MKTKNKLIGIVMCMLCMLFILEIAYAMKDTTKMVIIDLNIKEDKITELDSRIKYGYPLPHSFRREDFKVKILSVEGKLIKEYIIEDPRVLFYEYGPPGFKDDVNFRLIFPFFEDMQTISIHEYDNDKEIISIDLSEEIQEFCSAIDYEDPHCKAKEPEVTEKPSEDRKTKEPEVTEKPSEEKQPEEFPIQYPIIGIIVGIILLITVLMILKKRKR